MFSVRNGLSPSVFYALRKTTVLWRYVTEGKNVKVARHGFLAEFLNVVGMAYLPLANLSLHLDYQNLLGLRVIRHL